MSNDLIEHLLSSKMVFKGRIINLKLDTVRLPDGKRASREIVEHPGAVGIIAVTDKGGILLVEQYRQAMQKIMLEIPAGKLASGEDPLDCAKRELEEETGFKSDDVKKLFRFYTSPGFSDEILHLFIARNLQLSEQHFDEDEFINLVEVTVEEAYNMLMDGRIEDGKTAAAVLYLSSLAKTNLN